MNSQCNASIGRYDHVHKFICLKNKTNNNYLITIKHTCRFFCMKICDLPNNNNEKKNVLFFAQDDQNE